MQNETGNIRENDAILEAIELIQSIKGVCEVRLYDIFDIEVNNKKHISKDDFTENGKPVIHIGEISRRYDYKAKDTVSKIGFELFEKTRCKIKKNSILMCGEDFEVDKVGQCVLWLKDEEIALSGSIYILSLKNGFEDLADLEYLSYYFRNSKDFKKSIRKICTGSKVMRITKEKLEKIEIPLYIKKVQSYALEKLLKLDETQKENNIIKELSEIQYRAIREKTFEIFEAYDEENQSVRSKNRQ